MLSPATVQTKNTKAQRETPKAQLQQKAAQVRRGTKLCKTKRNNQPRELNKAFSLTLLNKELGELESPTPTQKLRKPIF
jgi:hypothetical protein